ncbi:T6SS effector BTH_I2691 family protein, partial [Herbaspirillum seropedicae]
RKLATAVRFKAIMAEHGPHHKGYIAALNDPVGMTNDLSELTMPDLQAGFDEKMHQSKMIADLLTITEQSVRKQAREDVEFSDKVAEMSANHPDGDTYNSAKTVFAMIKAGGPGRYAEKQREKRKKYGEDQAGRMQAAEDEAWYDLTHDNDKPTLDMKRIEEFPAQYEAALREFEPRFLQLVMAHLGWLKSEQLANWMEGVHDDADIRSGYAYSESMSQCIGKAACSKPCIEQLTRWISSDDLKDRRNLYGRALLFNQADIIAATETQLKGSDIQFENILNVYKGAVERLHDPMIEEQLIDRLALTTGNVVSKAISENSNVLARGLGRIHLHLLGGAAIKISDMRSEDVVHWALSQAREQGIKLETRRQQTRADARQEVARVRKEVKEAKVGQRFIAYELDIAKLEKEGRIAPGSIKGIGLPGVAMAQKWLGSGSPRDFKLGVVTMIVQMVALTFATKDLANNDQFNRLETRLKVTLAIVSLTATIVEIAAVSADPAMEHPLGAFIRRQWAVSEKALERIIKGARFFGALAGVVAGFYDILVNSSNANKAGDERLSDLYFINGILGIVLPAAIYFSIGAIAWPLFIFSFVVGIAIAYYNASALKNWVARCEFSTGEKYNSFEMQLKAFNDATGG